MKKLLNRAKELEITIYPFEMDILTIAIEKYRIPDDVIVGMDKGEMNKYIRALKDSQNEWAAGPFGDGWSHAHDSLKELGFVVEERVVGHRIFVSLKYVGQWLCGKCDQEKSGEVEKGAEPISNHFRTCPKRKLHFNPLPTESNK